MGIRLEWLVIALIILTIGVTTMVKLRNTEQGLKPNSKELEFHHTTFLEVDTHKMHSKSFVETGTRVEGVLNLRHLKYSTENITLLVADEAKYNQNILYLDGNINLQEREGYTFSAQNAEYNQTSAILTVASSFTASKGKSIIYGTSLYYDTINKEMNASKIDALVYTTKK